MTDAYAGAREDLSIWKKRALEAEALNRKFAASVNSPSFMGEPAAPSGAGEYPELPEWSKRDDLGGLVPSEVRQALRAYADETCEARAAAASKPQVKEARERRRWLSDSFNRGTQTLDEATVSARAMAASLLVPRAALATPAQAGEYPPLVCDYCGALTPDPWHSSGMLHGKMSKHIHSCDACAARGVAKAQIRGSR